jgi:serine/threonine protein phosphatase PrpC
MVFQVGEKILCANVGDSRAIMVKENNKVNKIIPLSIDQKPDDPEESKRIIENGGEISQFEEDGEKSGPFRVWKKGEAYPGIAMSRSIGDLIASTLGVIPVPKFIEEKIDNDTKFIVVASDGVWEFLDNQKVTDIVMPFYKKNDPDGACKALIKESTEWWNQEDVVVDDITVIVVFF